MDEFSKNWSSPSPEFEQNWRYPLILVEWVFHKSVMPIGNLPIRVNCLEKKHLMKNFLCVTLFRFFLEMFQYLKSFKFGIYFCFNHGNVLFPWNAPFSHLILKMRKRKKRIESDLDRNRNRTVIVTLRILGHLNSLSNAFWAF